MILRVALVQPIFDHYKREFYKYEPKGRPNNKKTASFATILGNMIKSQSARK